MMDNRYLDRTCYMLSNNILVCWTLPIFILLVVKTANAFYYSIAYLFEKIRMTLPDDIVPVVFVCAVLGLYWTLYTQNCRGMSPSLTFGCVTSSVVLLACLTSYVFSVVPLTIFLLGVLCALESLKNAFDRNPTNIQLKLITWRFSLYMSILLPMQISIVLCNIF